MAAQQEQNRHLNDEANQLKDQNKKLKGEKNEWQDIGAELADEWIEKEKDLEEIKNLEQQGREQAKLTQQLDEAETKANSKSKKVKEDQQKSITQIAKLTHQIELLKKEVKDGGWEKKVLLEKLADLQTEFEAQKQEFLIKLNQLDEEKSGKIAELIANSKTARGAN